MTTSLIVVSHTWTLICFSTLSLLFALRLSWCKHTRDSPHWVGQSMEVCPKGTQTLPGFRVSYPPDPITSHTEETMPSCGSWGEHQPLGIVQVTWQVSWTVRRNIVSRSGIGNMPRFIYVPIRGQVSWSEGKFRISPQLSSFKSVGPGRCSKRNINTECGRPSACEDSVCSPSIPKPKNTN